MRIKFSIAIGILLSFFLQQSVWAATPTIQATVSDNTVFIGEHFVFTIVLNNGSFNSQPDTSLLEKDFNISLPSQSMSSSSINGRSSHKVTWQISMQAKRSGQLVIPSLTVDSLKTSPINMFVKKRSSQSPQTRDNRVYIKNSLNKHSAYLGQSIIYTTKIYISRDSDGLDLMAPSLDNANIETYGQDKTADTVINGIRYKVITREFKIDVNKAGKYTVDSPLLTGNIRKTVSVNDWRTKISSEPIHIVGNSIQIEIKSKPANYQGVWLVSDDVKLFEEPRKTGQKYHVGEPITRTIILRVASIEQSKLPKIDFNYDSSLRIYPDQDKLEEGDLNGIRYAQRTMRHAIIADKAGKLTLPEIKIGWWNSKTDKQQFSTIPAQTLTILPSTKKSIVTPEANNVTPPAIVQKAEVNTPTKSESSLFWQLTSALLLLLLIAMVIYHLNYRRLQTTTRSKVKKTVVEPLAPAHLTLNKALKTQQPTIAYQALLRYTEEAFPTLNKLSDLAQLTRLNEQEKALLVDEIVRLENSCAYPDKPWNSNTLLKLINKHNKAKKRPINSDIMDLNP